MDKSLRIANIAQEIAWIERQIKEKILSDKNIKEYRRQIRQKEIELVYLRSTTN